MVRKNYVALVINGMNLSSRKRSHSTQSDSEWIEKNILILPQIHSGILKLKCEYPQAPSMFTSEKFNFGFLRATRKQEEKSSLFSTLHVYIFAEPSTTFTDRRKSKNQLISHVLATLLHR